MNEEEKSIYKKEITLAEENLKRLSMRKVKEDIEALERLYRMGALFRNDNVTFEGRLFLKQFCGDILNVLNNEHFNQRRVDDLREKLLGKGKKSHA